MKILVYGAGVIGGQHCHALCTTEHCRHAPARWRIWMKPFRRSGIGSWIIPCHHSTVSVT